VERVAEHSKAVQRPGEVGGVAAAWLRGVSITNSGKRDPLH